MGSIKLNKMKFWETKEGKIIGYVLHEHGNGMALTGIKLKMLELSYKDGTLTPEKFEEFMSDILKSMKRTNEALDYLYQKFKEKNDN